MKKNSVLLLFFVCVANLMATGQPLISGPACVIPGVTYQYLITGQWDSASTMQVCTTGAIILPINGPCTGSGSPLSSLLVTWNAGITTGTINITSSKGNTSLTVTETNPLKAGMIQSGSKLQSLLYQAVPSIVHCNPDTGGSCTVPSMFINGSSHWTTLTGRISAWLQQVILPSGQVSSRRSSSGAGPSRPVPVPSLTPMLPPSWSARRRPER